MDRDEDDVASYGAIIEYAHEHCSSTFEVNVSFREEGFEKKRLEKNRRELTDRRVH